jgi:hypothetical protein
MEKHPHQILPAHNLTCPTFCTSRYYPCTYHIPPSGMIPCPNKLSGLFLLDPVVESCRLDPNLATGHHVPSVRPVGPPSGMVPHPNQLSSFLLWDPVAESGQAPSVRSRGLEPTNRSSQASWAHDLEPMPRGRNTCSEVRSRSIGPSGGTQGPKSGRCVCKLFLLVQV